MVGGSADGSTRLEWSGDRTFYVKRRPMCVRRNAVGRSLGDGAERSTNSSIQRFAVTLASQRKFVASSVLPLPT
jgi:hypothetical protein